MLRRFAAILGLVVGCNHPPTAAPAENRSTDAANPPDGGSLLPPHVEASPRTASDAGNVAEPEPSLDEVLDVLFPGKSISDETFASCAARAGEARVRCLFERRYAGDPKAFAVAFDLFTRWKSVAGVEVAHTMDGGYRGMIRIEPAPPVGEARKHLEWVALSLRDFDDFFDKLEAYGKTSSPGVEGQPRFRFRPIKLRFMRSVAARTPSAYAHDWTVAYNLAGSLLVSADAVRETMFHEVFHLNDAAHGGWSASALGPTFDAIVARCGTKAACLAPYAPNDTMVRGGTYYAFQPGNGVGEYAAELSLRYYKEQRAALRGLPPPTRFKCGPPPNARAWEAMRDEFFGGIDATPACR